MNMNDFKTSLYIKRLVFLLLLLNTCYIITITDNSKLKGDIHVYIRIDLEADIPIYEQLKQEIIAGIAKKELFPGEKLPSVRALAADIGVNLHTVNKAYHQLRDDGYIIIHRQRGVVVHPDGIAKADDAYMKQLKKSLHPLIAASICRDISSEQFQEICAQIYDIYTDREDERK